MYVCNILKNKSKDWILIKQNKSIKHQKNACAPSESAIPMLAALLETKRTKWKGSIHQSTSDKLECVTIPYSYLLSGFQHAQCHFEV